MFVYVGVPLDNCQFSGLNVVYMDSVWQGPFPKAS